MRLHALCLITVLAAPLAAQREDAQAEALITRVSRGDNGALTQLAPITRTLMQLASGSRMDTARTRMAARASLAMAGSFTSPEAPKTARERQWRPGAVAALRWTLAADSSDSWSAEMLEQAAPYPYTWTSPVAELQQLRTLARRNPGMPIDLQLTRLRLEIERGSLDSAAELLTRLPSRSVSNAVRDHIAAELAFARGADSTGLAAYLAGARAINDSIDAGWYTRELLWIARPAELNSWGAISASAKGDWLEKFWASRDLSDARLPGSRLPEQFRRWRLALRDYRWESDGATAEGVPIGDLQYPGVGDDFPPEAAASSIVFAGKLAPGNHIIDDRGRMILRHGEPTRIANLPGLQHDDMATWSWAGPTGQILLGFSRPVIDSTVRMRYGMILRNRPQGDMMSVCQLDSRFCALAGATVMARNGRSRTSSIDRARIMAADFARMRNAAETTDGFRESYHEELHAITQAYGVAGGGVLVVVAVPADKLKEGARGSDGSHTYTSHLRIVVGDTIKGEVVGSFDSVRTWHLAKSPASDAFLSGYAVVNAPPGSWQVSVVVSDQDRRAGTGQVFGNIPVIPLDGRTLRVSDPILGRETSGLSWKRDGQAVPLNPSGGWHKNEPASLVYQVDGMVVGRSYETRIELWEVVGAPTAPRTVITFNETASQSSAMVRRDIALDKLNPADYRIVVRVRDVANGIETQRERRLAIRK